MKSHFYILILLTSILFSCTPKEQAFDKEKWSTKVFGAYHYREAMLKDVMENQLKEGDSYQSIIDRLGEPDNREALADGSTFWYEIRKMEEGDDSSNKMKTLFISVGADSLVKEFRVEEWKFQ